MRASIHELARIPWAWHHRRKAASYAAAWAGRFAESPFAKGVEYVAVNRRQSFGWHCYMLEQLSREAANGAGVAAYIHFGDGRFNRELYKIWPGTRILKFPEDYCRVDGETRPWEPLAEALERKGFKVVTEGKLQAKALERCGSAPRLANKNGELIEYHNYAKWYRDTEAIVREDPWKRKMNGRVILHLRAKGAARGAGYIDRERNNEDAIRRFAPVLHYFASVGWKVYGIGDTPDFEGFENYTKCRTPVDELWAWDHCSAYYGAHSGPVHLATAKGMRVGVVDGFPFFQTAGKGGVVAFKDVRWTIRPWITVTINAKNILLNGERHRRFILGAETPGYETIPTPPERLLKTARILAGRSPIPCPVVSDLRESLNGLYPVLIVD